MHHTCVMGFFAFLTSYIVFPPLISSSFTQSHSSIIKVEKEDRRKQNFANAPRDDGAWSKIVAQKEAQVQAEKESQ